MQQGLGASAAADRAFAAAPSSPQAVSPVPASIPLRGRTFLIGPVRGFAPDYLASVVAGLEADGWQVYWPARDTDQTDTTGILICTDNVAAIRSADVVHVVWDGMSQGCLFDLGAAFALMKPVIPVELPDATEGKSFQNMIRNWAARTA